MVWHTYSVTQDGYRIVYGILEFDPVLDSSNMNMSDWTKIATHIYSNYQPFDGFVILHGTDTMAYTSSALSFMLEGLGKAVVVTGSQVPMVQVRTDAVKDILVQKNFVEYIIRKHDILFV